MKLNKLLLIWVILLGVTPSWATQVYQYPLAKLPQPITLEPIDSSRSACHIVIVNNQPADIKILGQWDNGVSFGPTLLNNTSAMDIPLFHDGICDAGVTLNIQQNDVTIFSARVLENTMISLSQTPKGSIMIKTEQMNSRCAKYDCSSQQSDIYNG